MGVGEITHPNNVINMPFSLSLSGLHLGIDLSTSIFTVLKRKFHEIAEPDGKVLTPEAYSYVGFMPRAFERSADELRFS